MTLSDSFPETPASPARSVPPDDTPEGHRIRARTTWLLARYDYLQGDSAPQVCDRYGLSESTLRHRARVEGWRRIDQPDPDPVEDDADEGPVDCQAMADEALTRVRAALRRRRPAEAASWMRVHEKLSAVVTAREDRARRVARVDRARGGSAALDGLPAALDPLAAAVALAETQTRLGQAYADGKLPERRFEQLSALTRKAASALAGGDDAPGDGLDDGADLHPSHPDFSEDLDPEIEAMRKRPEVWE